MKTGNSKLDDYIEIAHNLTFTINDYFLNVYEYEKRLDKFMTDIVPVVDEVRENLINDYVSDLDFVIAFNEYLERDDDFMVFCNLLISAPDEENSVPPIEIFLL